MAYDPAGDMERQRAQIDALLAKFRQGANPMPMPNLNAINERITAVINELTRLQRAIEAEMNAQNPPADARLTRAEWERMQAVEADAANQASVDAARQSVAAGNTDAATRAQAEEKTTSKK